MKKVYAFYYALLSLGLCEFVISERVIAGTLLDRAQVRVLNLKSLSNPDGVAVGEAEVTFYDHQNYRQPGMNRLLNTFNPDRDFSVVCFEHKATGELYQGVKQSDGSVKVVINNIFNAAGFGLRTVNCVTQTRSTGDDVPTYRRVTFDTLLYAMGGSYYYLVKPNERATFAVRQDCTSGALPNAECQRRLFGLRRKSDYLSVEKGESPEPVNSAVLPHSDYSTNLSVYIERVPASVYQ